MVAPFRLITKEKELAIRKELLKMAYESDGDLGPPSVQIMYSAHAKYYRTPSLMKIPEEKYYQYLDRIFDKLFADGFLEAESTEKNSESVVWITSKGMEELKYLEASHLHRIWLKLIKEVSLKIIVGAVFGSISVAVGTIVGNLMSKN